MTALIKHARVLSEALFEESKKIIPGGVNSPIRACKELGMDPLVVVKGEAEYIEDIDGNRWIDYCMSWGALPLGHAHPRVVDAVCKQMTQGSSFGIVTPFEKDLALAIIEQMPSLEKIRFVSSGTEATMSALRLARGYTKKSVIVKFHGCYHGHFDALLVSAGSGVSLLPNASSLGVTKGTIQDTVCLPYNNEQAVKDLFAFRQDIAAVIVEPIAANMGLVPGSKTFLEVLREETEKAGALLIFDEVISGFRVGLGGAQKMYGITPDLTCLGKIIGGGLPAAAFGGKKEIMDMLAPLGGVYQAGTLSGNPLAMQAGLATLQELTRPLFYENLQEKADLLLDPIEDWLDKHDVPVFLQRRGSLFTFFFGVKNVASKEDLASLDPTLFSKFYVHLLEEGIYFPPSQWEACFISSAHKKESLLHTQKAILSFLDRLLL